MYQNPLKDVDSKVFTRMLRTDGSITISLRNFVGEEIKMVPAWNHILLQKSGCSEWIWTKINRVRFNYFTLVLYSLAIRKHNRQKQEQLIKT